MLPPAPYLLICSIFSLTKAAPAFIVTNVSLKIIKEINRLSDILPVRTYYEESKDYGSFGTHFHSYHKLILVREGIAKFKINQREFLAGPNSLVIIRAMDKHDWFPQKIPYKRYAFTVTRQQMLTAIREPKLLSFLSFNNPKSQNLVLLHPEIAEKLTNILNAAILESDEKKPFWSSRVITFIFHALIELYREYPDMFDIGDNSRSTNTIMQIQNYIAEHFNEKIILDQLAEKFFMSKFHLSRRFKAITGYSFKSYLIQYRIGKAQMLLRDTDKPVFDICYDVGYENLEHFIRIFHKYQGITPHQYRLYWYREQVKSRKPQETHVFEQYANFSYHNLP